MPGLCSGLCSMMDTWIVLSIEYVAHNVFWALLVVIVMLMRFSL